MLAHQPYLDALSTDPTDTAQPAHDAALTQQLVTDHLAGVDVAAVARFEPVLASSTQLVDLAVGDVITLDHQLDSPLILELDGVPVHEVSIGRVRRNFGVEVLGPAPTPRRRTSRLGVTSPA